MCGERVLSTLSRVLFLAFATASVLVNVGWLLVFIGRVHI